MRAVSVNTVAFSANGADRERGMIRLRSCGDSGNGVTKRIP
jgi:hypothetical protein